MPVEADCEEVWTLAISVYADGISIQAVYPIACIIGNQMVNKRELHDTRYGLPFMCL